MAIKIPPNNRYAQPNNSDNLGSIYSSFNLNLTESIGKLRLGNRLLLNVSTTDVAELTSYAIGFRYFAGAFWTVAGASNVGYPFKATYIDSSFAKVVNGGSVSGLVTTFDSTTSDIEIAFDQLHISNASDGKVYHSADGLTWTTLTAGGAGDPVMMTYYGNRMYCTKSKNLVQSWDKDFSVSSPSAYPNSTSNTLRLTATDSAQASAITFLRSSSNRIWIGTASKTGGKGYVYAWDGAQTSVNEAYRLESSGALACVIKDDVPYIVDGNGALLVFNGGTFKEIARLNRLNNKFLFNPFSRTNDRFIHPNGMSIIDGKINMLIDGTNYDATSHTGTQEVTIPSGVWEYDENIGLYHKHSIGLTKSGGTVTDYGQIKIYGVGALSEILTATSPITTDGNFLLGASYYTDNTNTTSGIFYDNVDNDEKKGGYLITPKILSQNIMDSWQKFYIRHKKLLDSSDKLIVKYRTIDTAPTEATITWTTTSKFTTTTDVSAFVVGDEVEVVQGKGSGKSGHITSISESSGTYTVILDESFSGVGGSTKARFHNWKKASSVTDQTTQISQFTIGATSSWIQFKVCMFFTGKDEIEDMILINAPHKLD